MDSPEQSNQRIVGEKQLNARLRLATIRVADADRERRWSIARAQAAGLSIRKIAAATGLSASRIHQLLHSEEVGAIPDWLNQLGEPKEVADKTADVETASPLASLQQRLAEEVEVLRWCVDWLVKLHRGERVVVNLRAETDPKTALVAFDQPRVLRVLERIAADLDELAGRTTTTPDDPTADPHAAGVKHRHRLGEPEPTVSSLSQREQRAILREKMGLPPSHEPRW
jgi:hypothetical protein